MADTFDGAFADAQTLVRDFRAGQAHSLSAQHQEQEARQDFIDKFRQVPARAALGGQMDALVYELYGLTDDEIATVEGA